MRAARSLCNLVSGGSHDVSLHHNLIADCNQRNPQLVRTSADVRNNVIYNWGELGTEVEGDARLNLVGNTYAPGPDTTTAHFPGQPISIDADAAASMRLYVDGNVVSTAPAGADDWQLVVNAETGAAAPSARREAAPFAYPPVTTSSAQEAYEQVLARAGATVPSRDAVDQRVVDGVRNDTGRIIDTQGEWPALAPGVPVADADHDGMADDWEQAHGLDPADIADCNQDADGDGTTNLEQYLGELAGD